jgi:hypothetical protein
MQGVLLVGRLFEPHSGLAESYKGYKGFKDGLQPETLADGNWLVRQKAIDPTTRILLVSGTKKQYNI